MSKKKTQVVPENVTPEVVAKETVQNVFVKQEQTPLPTETINEKITAIVVQTKSFHKDPKDLKRVSIEALPYFINFNKINNEFVETSRVKDVIHFYKQILENINFIKLFLSLSHIVPKEMEQLSDVNKEIFKNWLNYYNYVTSRLMEQFNCPSHETYRCVRNMISDFEKNQQEYFKKRLNEEVAKKSNKFKNSYSPFQELKDK